MVNGCDGTLHCLEAQLSQSRHVVLPTTEQLQRVKWNTFTVLEMKPFPVVGMSWVM